ncbi:hypothetical protein [Candidatus Mycoplasma haematobovis]|uniref:hypothetical protein n=1 Tax=Candidatus Mycoplasma haematobovis TaxID=432608 RepID=UPI000AD1A526|nr:hypothetical protein [Candidatus Mycoplasma haematobovis]
MFLVFQGRIYEKDKLVAICSFLGGALFFFGNLVYFILEPSWAKLFENISKITFNSNLLAFIVSGLYLYDPKHSVFKNNFLMCFTAILLWFAALGFWCILFPIFYIDLGNYLISQQTTRWHPFTLFFTVWNHAVNPLLFLITFLYCTKKTSSEFLTPVSAKDLGIAIYLYLISWVLWNILISAVDRTFPTYGILTNFNPYSQHVEGKNLYSLKSLLGCNIACVFLSCLLITFFSRISYKFFIINHYRSTGIVKITKGTNFL